MGQDSKSDAPWGIVSIKPQDVNHELPMQPITMMRNALGKEHGGSGVPLDQEVRVFVFGRAVVMHEHVGTCPQRRCRCVGMCMAVSVLAIDYVLAQEYRKSVAFWEKHAPVK